MPWYRDRTAGDWIALRYLPLFAALNLAWETAQLPLYTLWREVHTDNIVHVDAVHHVLG